MYPTNCSQIGFENKMIPGQYSIVTFSVSLAQLRCLDILGRTSFSSFFFILISPCNIRTFNKPLNSP